MSPVKERACRVELKRAQFLVAQEERGDAPRNLTALSARIIAACRYGLRQLLLEVLNTHLARHLLSRKVAKLLGTLAVPRHLARQLRLQEQKRPGPGRRLPEQQR